MPDDGPLYPVNLRLTARRCLVVGGGRVAHQKITGLLECQALVEVIAPAVDAVLAELVETTPALTWHERVYEPGDLEGFHLVITATDDAEVNRAVYLEAVERGIWVNSADDPANCTFTLPSRIRQGPLLVTFATGGQSPAVATWLRRRFSEEFDSAYATLIEMVGAERDRIRAEGLSTEGLNWQAALDSGMLDLIREGHLAEAKERLQACLSSSSD